MIKNKNHKKAFNKLDKDNDGYIAKNEFIDAVVNDMNLCNKTDANQLFKSFDSENQNSLDFNEFHQKFAYAKGEKRIGENPAIDRPNR